MKIVVKRKKYRDKIAIKDISLDFAKGKATLIIGASGGGKSTLIKCINGSTSFDGHISGFKREDIAYIPQFPMLNQELTVYETIYYSRRFACIENRKLSVTRIENIVKNAISYVGLTSVANRRIKDLSGGQRQRVSIAKEFVRGKKIIVADEIDTGLDVGVSRYIIRKLIELTHQENLTAIVISHNICNVELFDELVVLAKDSTETGRVVYTGKPSNAKAFFRVNDYVDILTKVNVVDEGGEGEAETYIRKRERMGDGK